MAAPRKSLTDEEARLLAFLLGDESDVPARRVLSRAVGTGRRRFWRLGSSGMG